MSSKRGGYILLSFKGKMCTLHQIDRWYAQICYHCVVLSCMEMKPQYKNLYTWCLSLSDLTIWNQHLHYKMVGMSRFFNQYLNHRVTHTAVVAVITYIFIQNIHNSNDLTSCKLQMKWEFPAFFFSMNYISNQQWFTKSLTGIFTVDLDIWHINLAMPCYFVGP